MTLDANTISMVKDRAERLFLKGRYRDALNTYNNISQYGEKDPRIYIRMGDISRRLNDTEEAITWYKKASDAFARQGFIIKAIAVCKMIINIDPSRDDVNKRLASLYSRQKGSSSAQPQPTKEEKKEESPSKDKPFPRTPLFSDFAKEELLEVIKKVRSHHVPGGTYLFREGDPGDSIYIIADGEVEVVGRTKDKEEVSLARLVEGDFFGEFGFFLNARRSADVRAMRDSTILELTKADLDEIISRHKGVSDVLFNFYKERVVDKLMALSRIFKPMTTEDRHRVLERLTYSNFKKDSLITRQGDRGSAMYLIKEGKVEVWVGDGKERKVIARLGEGDFFGEIALATGKPRLANVTALTDVVVVVFSRSVLKDVLDRYPKIKEILRGIIKERVTGIFRARALPSQLV